MITEDDFKGWKMHPVTKEFFKLLDAKREIMKDDWEKGRYSEGSPTEYAFRNLAMMHECKAYAMMQDIEYTDFLTESDGSKDGK